MRKDPDGKVEDGAVATGGGQAPGFAHRALVGPHDLLAGHHTMAIVFQPALEPLLEPTVHLLDLLGHEGASIRKCQNTYGRHGQCSLKPTALATVVEPRIPQPSGVGVSNSAHVDRDV